MWARGKIEKSKGPKLRDRAILSVLWWFLGHRKHKAISKARGRVVQADNVQRHGRGRETRCVFSVYGVASVVGKRQPMGVMQRLKQDVCFDTRCDVVKFKEAEDVRVQGETTEYSSARVELVLGQRDVSLEVRPGRSVDLYGCGQHGRERWSSSLSQHYNFGT